MGLVFLYAKRFHVPITLHHHLQGDIINLCLISIESPLLALVVILRYQLKTYFLIYQVKDYQSIITHSHKERVRESSQMAWEGFGMVGVSATIPGGVGWVFIATPYKLVVVVQKQTIMTCTGVALLRQLTALPQLPEIAHVTSQRTP